VPPPSTSFVAITPTDPTPVSSDEEEKEERFKRMTEKRKAALKGHDEDDHLPIVTKKPFDTKKPLIGLSGIKINIANANALPTKSAQERIQEEAKLRAAKTPPQPNPLLEWIPVVKEKDLPAIKSDALTTSLLLDPFAVSFLPPPPLPPSIDLLLPPPPVPPSLDFFSGSLSEQVVCFLPPPPIPPSEIDMV